MPFSRFIIFQLLILAVICGLGWWIVQPLYGQTAAILCLVAAGLAGGAGIVAYLITLRGIEKRVALFMNFLMGGMLAKLFVGIVTVSLVAIKLREFAVPFVLTYFFSYILFTSFEVYALMRNLRPILKERERDSDEETGKN